VALPLGRGVAVVEPKRVVLDWQGSEPTKVLKELFEAAFLIDSDGLIRCAAWDDGTVTRNLATRVKLQTALKRTFLQHGKSTTKRGGLIQKTVEIDGEQLTVELQPYQGFAHRGKWQAIVDGLPSVHVELAGWAYPGATERHKTRCEYTPAQALAACFGLAGAVCFETPHGGGVLVMLEPDDLVRFARTRPLLTPRNVTACVVGGVGDAVLTVQLALRADVEFKDRPGVASTHAVLLRAHPWATQQKTRSALLAIEAVDDATLDIFEEVTRTLPPRVRLRDLEDGTEDSNFFVATSELRSFIADNVASHRWWFEGFATARTSEKKPRFIHYFRGKDNLGALFREERKGLISMVEKHLDDAEKAFVRSIHVALRQRFGAIAEESKHAPATMKNRFANERDRWRLAFAGSKTPDQVRAALADLWSRAGPNSELRSHWEELLPFMRPDKWQLARDLALVALASYQGTGTNAEESQTEAN
jgi:CRISPR-associated protein Cas8a1/Csx13